MEPRLCDTGGQQRTRQVRPTPSVGHGPPFPFRRSKCAHCAPLYSLPGHIMDDLQLYRLLIRTANTPSLTPHPLPLPVQTCHKAAEDLSSSLSWVSFERASERLGPGPFRSHREWCRQLPGTGVGSPRCTGTPKLPVGYEPGYGAVSQTLHVMSHKTALHRLRLHHGWGDGVYLSIAAGGTQFHHVDGSLELLQQSLQRL